MGSPCWAAATASLFCGGGDGGRPKAGLVGFGRRTVCGPLLDAVRAAGLGGVSLMNGGVKPRAPGTLSLKDGGVRPCASGAFSPTNGGVRLRPPCGVRLRGASLTKGGVWPRATASELGPSSLSSAERTASGRLFAATAAAAVGSCVSKARDTDLARYSTSRRPTTESKPGSDNRKLHASLAQWLNPSCKKKNAQPLLYASVGMFQWYILVKQT